jgi:amino acid adenylation domain-containing protein
MTEMILKRAAETGGDHLGRAGLPLSFAQEQLWFIDEFHHGLAAHNLPGLVRLRGPLDAAALGRALDGVAARHEALRTRLLAGPDGRPAQVVDPPGTVELPVTDQPGRDSHELAAQAALEPFHLATDWPLRAQLIRLDRDDHALVLVTHRTAFDAASWPVLLAELAALYGAEADEAAGLGDAPVQFADYAVRERAALSGAGLARLEEFWLGALGGFETSQFPADRPRPLLASHDGAVAATVIDDELAARLRDLAAWHGSTLPDLLLAALQALLYRYTGQTDVVIGTVAAHRDRPELAGLIGSLAGPLPVRADLSGDPAFTDLLDRVRAAAQAARDHQALPFARVVETLRLERDPGRFPVFQIGLDWPEPPAAAEAGGVAFRFEPVELRASMYDLGFTLRPAPGGLRIEATYPPALFDTATVQRLLGHWAVLLRGIADQPGARLSELPVLTEAERHRELTEWNDTATELPVTGIHQGFEARVAAAPAAVAAEFEGQSRSYDELNRQANQIARRLRAAGVGPEVLVGVGMATGLDRLAALLGIWKAGGGYVPLDPAAPPDRLAFMITDTAMPVILTDHASAQSIPEPERLTVVNLDAERERIAALDDTSLDDTGVTPASVAYVIYTSGSTGQPKGVVVEHRQAINFLHGMVRAWRIGPDSAVLSFAAVTFDVSVMDMFMPLLGGARIVLAAPATLHSPPRLAQLIRDRQVTFACLPPAVLALLTGEQFPELRTLLSAGEELTTELLRAWLRPGLEIYNGYGPTECSIGATFMKLEPATQLPPPIGRPKPNYQAYVLDASLNPVPVGVIGELHIGGAGVARGYLNRPELTRERFIPDPFRDDPQARLYKTGDLVRRRADGTIGFAGRADNQVKIRGLRIELGEIEAALTAHPAVAQAVVVVRTDPAGEKQLAAYARPEGDPPPSPAELRAHLARTVPAYMIPAHLILLDRLPLTINGKIDKAALPAPEPVTAGAGLVPPRTLLETLLVDLYATVLGHEQVGAADSFFDAGGSSLQAMRLVTELRSSLAVDLDVSAIFVTPAPQQLAGLLRDQHGLDDAELTDESLDNLTSEAGAADMKIETVAREGLARVLDTEVDPADQDPDLDLADGYGLTSLNKVVFLMSACDDTGVSLSEFTEPDVAGMRTLRDVVTALARFAGTAA